ncbi:MAG TPA: hypothetical protein VNK91_05360, partial [Burkholderiaceae bacterium]|nr:hypothetical protein [Burkholderiaceae bacterium]
MRPPLLEVDRERRPQVLRPLEKAAPAAHIQVVGQRHTGGTAHREHLLEQAAQHHQRVRRAAYLAQRQLRHRAGGGERL